MKERSAKTRVRSSKAKGRRLQTYVAERLSEFLGLSIEAIPPTKPGERNGAVYVPEGTGDLRIRRMGEAGCDVVLVTEYARKQATFKSQPLFIECKNTEAWALDAMFWAKGSNAFILSALDQARRSAVHAYTEDWMTVLVLGKNRWPPLAVWQTFDQPFFDGEVCLRTNEYMIVLFETFLKFVGKR